jgi:phosphatidylglycerophosphate synthase
VNQEMSRRPLKTRAKHWPRQLAFGFVRLGLTPNQVSVASVFVAAGGAVALWLCGRFDGRAEAALFVLAAGCIQLRLLCNLLDGLMAVEGGLKTRTGEIFNEFPDRIADVLLLAGAGYSISLDCEHAVALGYLCAIAALLTAYVRAFGGSVGVPQDFSGPMAKPHRMFALTLACLFSAFETVIYWPHRMMLLALLVIFVATLYTACRRGVHIARLLNAA